MDIDNSLKKERILKFMKQTKLVLLLFVISFALILEIPLVKGSYVVAGVKTKINFEYDGHTTNFVTYKTTLIDAVREQGINVQEQDLFNKDRDTRLNGGEVNVEVLKSWPIVISDNGHYISGRTVYDDPRRILEQNQVRVWPEDIVTTDLVLNPVEVGGIGQMVIIQRAPVYKIAVDRKIKEVRTWDRNVQMIIERSATKLNPNDIIVPGVKESVSNGSTISITRINYADISKTESIPFQTVYQGSTSLAFGTIKAIISGITGSKKDTYRITYKDGDEVSRSLMASKITQAKRDAKILRGAVIGKASYVNAGVYPAMSTAFRGYKGRYLFVTNLNNGKSVKVKVVDFGPRVETGKIIDLSQDAFEALGVSHSQGIIQRVMVELLD